MLVVTWELIENFLIAMLIGLIVGLEREFQQQNLGATDFAGIRTYTLIALFGWIIGYMTQWIQSIALLIVGIAGMISFIIAAYIAVVWRQKKIGATSEFSAIIVFLLGIIVSYGHILIAIISMILMTTVLSYKSWLHHFAKRLQLDEVHAALKFGIISVVLLPLLPNKTYAPTDIPYVKDLLMFFPSRVYDVLAASQAFNPLKIWLMVVFICGISFVGYISIKIIGAKKGIGLTGAIGGLVSSTAVTSSLSLSSKKSKVVNAFVFGVVIAWTIMFFRVLFVTLVLNKQVFVSSIVSIGFMGFVSACCSVWLYWHKTGKVKQEAKAVAFKSPFAIAPALKFGVFFAFILLMAKLLQGLYGSSGIYIASVLSGLADVDAITISMATIASAGEITTTVAVTAIVLAVVSNTLVKAGIAYIFGGREFAKKVLICAGIIIAAGFVTVFIN